MPGARALLFAAAVLGAGCASNVPREISEPLPDSPGVADAAAMPERVEGRHVRWGGTVAAVQNRADGTELELVTRELGAFGRPRATDASAGRALVRVPEFLDPAIYAEGRAVSVYGTLAGREQRLLGERPYDYPVVRAEKVYLWPERPPLYVYPYPDPFYDPWFDSPLYGPWGLRYRFGGPADPWLWGWGPYPFRHAPYRWWGPYRPYGAPWWW